MRKNILLLLIIIFCVSLKAQETLTPSGGQLSGSGGQASYTIGQVSYHMSGEQAVSYEGVQQSLEYLLISGEVVIIEHHSGEMLICKNVDNRWHCIKWYRNETLVEINNYIFEAGGLNGIYYAVVTDANGQEFYSQRYYYSTSVVSTKSLMIYPVPVETGQNLNIFYSNGTSNKERMQMQIFDTSGKMVKKEIITLEETHSTNTSTLSPGVYTIMIDNETSKILVR